MTIIFGNTSSGSTYAPRASASIARQILQLRSMSTQPSTAVAISGGSIAGASLASSAVAFTGGSIIGTCIASSAFSSTNVNITGGSIAGVILSGSFSSTAMYIYGGLIANTPIGATAASSANFTALAASSAFSAVSGSFTSAISASSAAFTNTVSANHMSVTSGVSASSGDIAGQLTVGGLVSLATTNAGQVSFPPTQNPSTDPNTLDDYEEGPWTPTLGGTATYLGQSGRYTKVGRMVFIRGTLYVDSIGSGSTTTITGLPFTPVNDNPCSVQVGGSAVTFSAIYGIIGAAGIVFTLNNAAASGNQASAGIFQNGTYVDLCGCYEV